MLEGPVKSLFAVIHRIEEWLLGAGMLVIAALTIANVLSRTLLDYSLAFAVEVTQFMIVLVCFVGLSYAASKGRHIRMTALYDLLPLKPRKWLMIFIAAVTALLMFYLAYWSLAYVYILFDLGSFSPVLGVPMFIVYLSAPIGLTLAGIHYLLTIIRNLTDPEKVYVSFERTDEYEKIVTDADLDTETETPETAPAPPTEHGKI